ncbi:lipopolysaccharide assembly protein LapA domain-containing protein [Ottowia sp.]|uniref:lipopolysaccharide assembly protein LapA domain-containing protein n=1 Tax=Ottowia sp. TaxID=1898956 RepID=UPI003A845FCC
MTTLTRLLKWILKAAIFFALFAFALNNQQETTVHLLFGHQWRAPMTLVVLIAFVIGMAVGVLGMMPGWWVRRKASITPTTGMAEHAAEDDTISPSPHGI